MRRSVGKKGMLQSVDLEVIVQFVLELCRPRFETHSFPIPVRTRLQSDLLPTSFRRCRDVGDVATTSD